jgi:hypothetical protein
MAAKETQAKAQLAPKWCFWTLLSLNRPHVFYRFKIADFSSCFVGGLPQ